MGHQLCMETMGIMEGRGMDIMATMVDIMVDTMENTIGETMAVDIVVEIMVAEIMVVKIMGVEIGDSLVKVIKAKK